MLKTENGHKNTLFARSAHVKITWDMQTARSHYTRPNVLAERISAVIRIHYKTEGIKMQDRVAGLVATMKNSSGTFIHRAASPDKGSTDDFA